MNQLHRDVEAVRRFNRFYTRRIGVLQEGWLGSELSLTEGRVLYELAQGRASAAEIATELALDPGYLSRLLAGLERRSLVERRRSSEDGRRRDLALTEAGEAVFRRIDEQARHDIGAMLEHLPGPRRRGVVTAMGAIEEALDGAAPAWTLRPHTPGDMGWVVERHGALYAQEYGWDGRFEALCARIVADFLETLDPMRERCWIAERAGERLGCVFLVKKDREVARLRLLLVEPPARGLGVGRGLVDACIGFAREAGYRRITLWTNDVLVSARRIYEAAGFRLVAEERHTTFGPELTGQTWELELQAEA